MFIKDVFENNKKCCFLAGAGISFEAPSNIPVAKKLLFDILSILNLDKAYVDDFSKKIEYSEIRFEQFIGDLISSYDDNGLHILDFLVQCKSPNFMHFFLAEAIRQGHTVFTTNFDMLIEKAGKDMGMDITSVFAPVLNKLKNDNELCLYKIHGTILDHKGADQRQSIVTTMETVGKKGEGFSLDPYVRQLFQEKTGESDLVILGYSGSDDFDIMPALSQITSNCKLIWIYHTNENNVKAHSYDNFTGLYGETLAIANLVNNGKWKKEQIIFITGYTLNILYELCKYVDIIPAYKKHENFIFPEFFFSNWKYEHALEKWRDLFFASSIYNSLGYYSTAVRILYEALEQVQLLKERIIESYIHDYLSINYMLLKEYKKAEGHLDECNRLLGQAIETNEFHLPHYYINKAICHCQDKDYEVARDFLVKAEAMVKNKNEVLYAGILYEKARIHKHTKDKPTAMNLLEEALEIHRNNGRLGSMCKCYISMISLLLEADVCHYKKIISLIGKVEQLCFITHNLDDIGECFHLKSNMFYKMGLLGESYKEALNALDTYRKIDFTYMVASVYTDIGTIAKKTEAVYDSLKIPRENTASISVLFNDQFGVQYFLGEVNKKVPYASQLFASNKKELASEIIINEKGSFEDVSDVFILLQNLLYKDIAACSDTDEASSQLLYLQDRLPHFDKPSSYYFELSRSYINT
jgi:tetratricopeptide (TPR) repeat protein